jgi:hypothetical protein
MSTLVPHLSLLITLARLHGACVNQPLPSARPSHHATSDVAVVLLLLGFAFTASVVRVAGQITLLMTQLLRVAATVGAALVMVLIVAGLAILALLH